MKEGAMLNTVKLTTTSEVYHPPKPGVPAKSIVVSRGVSMSDMKKSVFGVATSESSIPESENTAGDTVSKNRKIANEANVRHNFFCEII